MRVYTRAPYLALGARDILSMIKKIDYNFKELILMRMFILYFAVPRFTRFLR